MTADHDQNMDIPSQAAMWLSRMQRPDCERFRVQFEEWLGARPEHRAAYNKAAARFHDARLLSRSDRWKSIEGRPVMRRGRAFQAVWSILLVLLAGGLVWLVLPAVGLRPAEKPDLPSWGTASQAAMIESRQGEIANKRLADGSTATIDTGGKLRFAFAGDSRDLWLERGRARFAVVHDGRPFVVHAAGGSVTATGTLFDVAVDPDGSVRVTLLEGGVDVRPEATDPSRVRSLKPGETLRFSGIDPSLAVAAAGRQGSAWPQGMAEFDAASLAQVVEQANRYANLPIRLGDERLGLTKVSGRFRINEADRLAGNLARMLDLKVERTNDAIILRQ